MQTSPGASVAPTPQAPATAPVPARAARAAAAPQPSGRRRRLPTPTLLRAAAVVIAVLAVVAAAVASATTASRRADVRELATATAGAATAAGDANAAFASADAMAVALTSPGATSDTELRFLQSVAAGVNSLERAAALTTLGDQAEAPIRRVLRTISSYGAEVEAGRVAAAAGDTAAASAARARASALMANLLRANTAAAAVQHDDALQRQAHSVHDAAQRDRLLVAAFMVLLLVVLAVVQVIVQRRFRRLVNVPLALATLAVLVVTIVSTSATARQSDRLRDAVDVSYAGVQQFTAARDIAFTERAARTIDELAPGTVDVAPLTERFRDAVMAVIAVADNASGKQLALGLMAYDDALARPTDAAAEAAGAPGTASSAFNVLNAGLLQGRSEALTEFDATIARAQSNQATLVWLVPVVLVVAAGLAWLGLQRRLAEYR